MRSSSWIVASITGCDDMRRKSGGMGDRPAPGQSTT
jgi:hypothetical protein